MKLWSRLICLILVLIGLDSQSQIMLPAFQGAFKKADDADVIWNFRYVRVEFTATNHNGGRAMMNGFWAYNCSGTDIALSSVGATAVAYGNSTSNAASSGGSETPGIAIDNSEGTRWMSSETIGTTNFDAINWVVDLQSPKLLTEIKLNIYQNYTFSFNVYGSTDNSSWVSMGTYSGTGQTYVSFTKAAPSLAIGDSFFGGKIAYLDGNGCGFVAATSEQSSQIRRWHNGSNTTTGATGTAIGTGLANTNAIISSQGGATGSYAAGICADYSVTDGGVTYDDWYLPSEDELNQLHINRAEIGGFVSSSPYTYWTSSQSSLGYAWSQEFGGGYSGNQTSLQKVYTYNIRAVRTF
jgi:hypothetical protein